MKKFLTVCKIASTLSLGILLSGCNKDKEKISAEQIRQTLFDMKGTYHGTLEVSFYHGSDIENIENAVAISRDSLLLVMPLGPIADVIDDQNIAAILRNAGKAEVKAGYEFLQIDEGGRSVHFVLKPKNMIIPANGNTPDITIVFSDIFGGDFERNFNFIMFNVSPKEMLVKGAKLESFKQLVYHFRGEYE